jgi:hypothetical protein
VQDKTRPGVNLLTLNKSCTARNGGLPPYTLNPKRPGMEACHATDRPLTASWGLHLWGVVDTCFHEPSTTLRGLELGAMVQLEKKAVE